MTELNINVARYWTDSKVALDWISDHASRRKTYCKPSGEIQVHTHVTQWSHVRPADNPADIDSNYIEQEMGAWI